MKTASLKPSRRRRTRHTRTRRLLFEGLEDRRLLTGVELISAAHPDLISATAGGESSLYGGSMSADGRYVAFVSTAPDLVEGLDIAPGVQNVYRYDHHTGEVVLVSMNTAGTGGGNGTSLEPVISADGSVIAFRSSASNLHSLDTNTTDDIFARNLTTGTTLLVSVNTDRTGSGNGLSQSPVISADGSVIAFQSSAADLHPLDADTNWDIFARNLTNRTTHLVSVNIDGTDSGNGVSHQPVISADGSVIAFVSSANNLHTLDTGIGDIFARNLTNGTTLLVSVNAAGTGGGNHQSTQPAISADGSVIAFASGASNLHALDGDTNSDVFARNLTNSTTHLVSVNKDGTGSGDDHSWIPVISADGSVVAFESRASNLHDLDTNGTFDVFARNLTTGTMHLVSVNVDGTSSGNNESYWPVISADGSVVAFGSFASDLQTLNTAGFGDIFARDLTTGTTQLMSVNAAGTGGGDSWSDFQLVSANGSVVAFASSANNLVQRDLNGFLDVFRSSLSTTEVSLIGDDVVITDTAEGNTNDTITISSDGTSLFLHDPNNRLATSIPGTTGDGSHLITIPLPAFSGAIVINTLGGDDTVTIDFSGGNPLQAGGLTFDGGDGDDRLRVVGYSLTDADGSADLVVTNTSFDSGSVELAGLGTLNFDKIAALTVGGTAADVAISLPPDADSVTLGDDGGTQDGDGNTANTSALYDSTGPVYSVAYIEFSNPTNSLWIKRGDATADLNVLDLAVANMAASLAVGEVGGEFNQVTFSGPLMLAEDKNLVVHGTGTISLATADADLAASGTGAIALTTARNIVLASGSSVTTVDGSLTLEANQQPTATGGSFVGVEVLGSTIQSLGLGAITVKGRGGNTGSSQDGVYIEWEGKIIGGGSGPVLVEGVGGATSGGATRGVFLNQANSRITSTGGSVFVSGQAAANNSSSSHGVVVVGGADISAGGDGTVTVAGQGGGTAVGGHNNAGIFLGSSNARITSNNGSVSVHGTGGGSGASNNNDGVRVTSSGVITAGGSGSVTVTGYGGNVSGSGNLNYGVQITSTDSQVTSDGGDISITGVSGGGASSEAIAVSSTGQIVSSAGTAVVTLVADSLNLESDVSIYAGSNPVVVRPRTSGTNIDLGGADVLSGTPRTLGLTDAELDRITAGTLRIGDAAAGAITISAAMTPAGVDTLHLVTGASISQSAPISVANLAAEAAGNVGFNLATNDVDVLAAASSSGFISFGDLDDLTIGTVDGISGVSTAQGVVNLLSKNLTVSNTAADADIAATSTITLMVDNASGLLTVATGARVRSLGGNHTYVANTMDLSGTIEAGSQIVTLRPLQNTQAITLGSSTDTAFNTLELSDAELDRVTAGTLRIGMHTSTSPMVISQSISPAGTDTLHLISGGAVSQSNGVVITADKLAIEAGGPVSLADYYHQVNTLAMASTSGTVEFRDGDGFAVGVVDGIRGVRTSDGNVILVSETGNVTIEDAGVENEIEGRFASLILRGNDAQLTVAAGAQILTHVTGVNLWADKIDLQGSVLAVGQQVTLRPHEAGKAIDLGSGVDTVPNTLELSDAELDRITAGTLRVGTTTSGGMTITANINPAGTDTLHLISGGAVSQSNGVVITVDKLAIEAGGPVSLADYYHQVNTLAMASTSGTVEFRDGNGFAVGIVDGIRGVRTTDGNVILVSETGNLTIEDAGVENEIEGRFASLMLRGNDAQLTVAAGAQILTHVTGANLWADKIDLQGSVMAAGQQVTLRPHQAGEAIDLGSGVDTAPNTLELSDAELDRITTGTLHIGNVDSGSITVSAALTHGNHLNVTTGNGVTFNQLVTMAADKDLVVTALGTATGAITLATADADLAASGNGTITLSTARNIVLSNGSSVTAIDGALTLQANQQATPTSGNFIGVDVNGGTVDGGSGGVTIKSRGGNSSNYNYGVRIVNSAQVSADGGAMLVEGIGGGSDSGTSAGWNNGVEISSGGAITNTGTSVDATVTVNGLGGNRSGSVDSMNYGVNVEGANSRITSSGGALLVEGTGGGAGASGSNVGVGLQSGGMIVNGGMGPGATVTVVGMGGNTSGSGSYNYGVWVTSTNSQISSSDGAVLVQGTGGGTGASSSNQGVSVENGGVISSAGTGAEATVTVMGVGGDSSGSSSNGVNVLGGARITSAGGAISVHGESTTTSSTGIRLAGNGQIAAASGTPTVTLTSDSMDLTSTTSISAAGATVTLKPGTAGTLIDLGGADVLMSTPRTLGLTDAELDRITAGTLRIGDAAAGAITISAAMTPAGVDTLHLVSGASISQSAPISVANLAAEAAGNVGFNLATNDVDVLAAASSSGFISFGDLDALTIGTVDGISGVSTAQGVVNLLSKNLTVSNTAADADIAATGTITLSVDNASGLLTVATGAKVRSLGGNHTYVANKMDLSGTIEAGSQIVTLRPLQNTQAINLGSSTDTAFNTLELSDAELDRVTAGTLRIGRHTSTSPMVISQSISPAGTDTLHLISGGTIDDGQRGQLIVSQLAVESQGSILLDGFLDNGTPVYHQVGVFAGHALAQGSSLTFISQGGTVIGTVDGITGASANGGGVTVITHSPLTVDSRVIEQGGGPIRLAASTDDGVNDHLTINSPVQVVGGSGGIELTAGSDVRITSNATSSGSILTGGGGTISIVAEHVIAIDGASILAQLGGSVDLVAGTDLVIQSGNQQASITAVGGGSVGLSAGADLVIQASDGGEVLIAADGQGTVAATAGGYVDVDGAVQITAESEPPTLSGTALLTVAVQSASRLYGHDNPQFTVTFDGFVPGDDASVLTGELLFATNATTHSDVGDYAVTANGLTFEGSGLVYEIQFVDGVLTVNPAQLTVTVNDAHKVEGDANPTFTVRYDGFVLDQDATVLGGAVSFHTDVDASSPAGAYSIAAEGLTSNNYDITFVSGTLFIHPQVLKPYSISGLVYVDFNNDGEVNFGESGIAGVAVTLTGTNDLELPVNETVWTDDDGFYKFADLRPGDYHVSESQPESYLQGINGVGTLGGVLSGVDQFFLELGEVVDTGANTDGLNYNFGERPPADGTIQPGQTAGIGFWQNKNGQALIQSLNGGAQATHLGDWLAATLPGMFGHLSGGSNTEVGSYFRTLFAVRGQKLEAQVMATALAVYITNVSLAGTAGEAYGFVVTQYGVGNRLYNVGTNGAAFGVQDHSDVSVLDLLRATDTMAVGGVLYYSNSSSLMQALRNMADEVYSDING